MFNPEVNATAPGTAETSTLMDPPPRATQPSASRRDEYRSGKPSVPLLFIAQLVVYYVPTSTFLVALAVSLGGCRPLWLCWFAWLLWGVSATCSLLVVCPPRWLAYWALRRNGRMVVRVHPTPSPVRQQLSTDGTPPAERGRVALAFYGAPRDEHSVQHLLEVLGQHNASATFFIVGKEVESDTGSRLLQQILQAGCDLGNAGWTGRAAIGLTPDALRRGIQRTDETLHRAALAHYGCQQGRASAQQDGGEVGAALAVQPVRWYHPAGERADTVVATTIGATRRLIGGWLCPFNAILPAWVTATILVWRTRPGDIVLLHDTPAVVGVLERVLAMTPHLAWQSLGRVMCKAGPGSTPVTAV